VITPPSPFMAGSLDKHLTKLQYSAKKKRHTSVTMHFDSY
jgi:hypothetical protein